MAVVTKFDAAINRNKAAQNNLANALSFSQTQDGFLQKVSQALDRMGELMLLGASSTIDNSSKDWARYFDEYLELESFISDVGTREFNGVSLFSGTSLSVTKDSDGNTWDLNSVLLNDTGGDLSNVYSEITDVDTDGSDIWYIDDAESHEALRAGIEMVAASRAKVGANIRRLQFTSDQLGALNENLSSSISRIKDVDVAVESTRFARFNILTQTGTAMLSQANLMPRNALRLLP